MISTNLSELIRAVHSSLESAQVLKRAGPAGHHRMEFFVHPSPLAGDKFEKCKFGSWVNKTLVNEFGHAKGIEWEKIDQYS